MRTVNLPFSPPLLPMLAKRIDDLPTGEGFLFEPKWDGFRTLIFRDGDELFIQSRDEKPLNRYFPEVEEALKAQLPPRCVLDGELVIARNEGLDFEALQMRIHPAASRVKMLAKEIPTSVVFWDLLALDDEDLRSLPLQERRARLEKLKFIPPLHITPATTDRATAADWFNRFEGAGLDGVMAKPIIGAYEPNKRSMFKVKHKRTCECVVAGFRWHKNGNQTHVGSLLLGLYDKEGKLHHVGVTASFTEKKRRELVAELEPYRKDALENHPWREWGGLDSHADGAQRMPGAKSRWSTGKTLEWEPLRPELVVEVEYDHMQGSRFRHTAQFQRFRVDKKPSDCDYEQLETTAPYELKQIFQANI
jgi:ATP-dependent DNA ligase